MATTETILNGMLHNISTMQHLYTKLDSKNAEWRPQPNMRTTLELLQYVCSIGQSTVSQYINPAPDPAEGMKRLGEYSAKSSALAFGEIPQALEEQKQNISSMMKTITDADLSRTTSQAWGGDLTLEDALINNSLQFLNAYRHQLFLYAKMCGATINTSNNWGGMDSPAPAAQPASAEEATA